MVDESKATSEREKTFLSFSEVISTAASTVVVASAVVYIVGWLHARAYFASFGASWLVAEISPFQLLRFSWLPLSTLFVFTFLRIYDELERQEAGKVHRIGGKWAVLSLAFLAVLYVAAQVLRSLNQNQAAYTVGSSLGILFAVYIGAEIRDLFVTYRARRVLQPSVFAGLASLILFFGIYFVPKLMGEVQGAYDADPELSQLPRVRLLAPSSPDLRLVTVTDQALYVAVLSKDPEKYPTLRPVERSQVAAVQMGKP